MRLRWGFVGASWVFSGASGVVPDRPEIKKKLKLGEGM